MSATGSAPGGARALGNGKDPSGATGAFCDPSKDPPGAKGTFGDPGSNNDAPITGDRPALSSASGDARALGKGKDPSGATGTFRDPSKDPPGATGTFGDPGESNDTCVNLGSGSTTHHGVTPNPVTRHSA